MSLTRGQYEELIRVRVQEPDSLSKALLNRKRRTLAGSDGRIIILAADHTARGKIALGADPLAMADRFTLLDRLVRSLAMPEVDGVLASADVLEELAWLGALNSKLAIGTINRGGIIGASWELDDRISAYDVEHIEALGLDGGKTLLRINHNDSAVARTIETVARVTTELADRKLMSMIEALPYTSDSAGRHVLDSSTEAMIKVVAIASGLGSSSAHSWLKVPPSARMSEIAGATTLPILMLGGESGPHSEETFGLWAEGMQNSNVRGVVAGRNLLYPSDGDCEAAVRRAQAVVRPETRPRDK